MTFYQFYRIKLIQMIIDTFFPEILDRVDYSTSEWRGSFFRQLETNFEQWNCQEVSCIGKTLAQCIKESLGWKTGDLKNGWKSISVSQFPIQESDLYLVLTGEWVGLKIYKKDSEISVLI